MDGSSSGDVTYEDLFRVLPFGNHAFLIGPVKMSQLLGLLQRSIQSCGSYGAPTTITGRSAACASPMFAMSVARRLISAGEPAPSQTTTS